MSAPLDRLRHHVTGAIERGDAEPVVEQADYAGFTDYLERLAIDYGNSETAEDIKRAARMIRALSERCDLFERTANEVALVAEGLREQRDNMKHERDHYARRLSYESGKRADVERERDKHARRLARIAEHIDYWRDE